MANDAESHEANAAEHRVLIQLFGALKETVQNHNDGPNGGRLAGAFADAVSILGGRTAQCAQCGDCCQRLHFKHTYLELQALAAEPGTDFAFVKAHWRPAAGEPLGTHYFACDAYDSDSHLCTAHEERPGVCRGYPWYGREPTAEVAEKRLIGTRCSYWHDIPRDQWPEGIEPLPSPPPGA